MGCASISKDKSKLHVGDYISRIGMERIDRVKEKKIN